MQNLKLKLTANAPRNYKSRLTIQCSVPGTTIRHYMLVPDIQSVDLGNWNEALQCFLGTDVTEEKAKQIGASSNYLLYFTLHNKLKGVNLKKRTTFTPATYNGQKLYDTPLSDVTDYHFRAFGEWKND